MDGPALYPVVRQLHVGLVVASVAFFVLRGGSALAGATWPRRPAVRIASASIDTLLLAAGASLWWFLQLHPLRDRWLLVKLVLIVAYIGLGTWVTKGRPGRAGPRLAYVAALACIGCVAAIAITRDPLAPLRAWSG